MFFSIKLDETKNSIGFGFGIENLNAEWIAFI